MRTSFLALMLAFAAAAQAAVATDAALDLPGREADARVARIAWRLATAGAARCPVRQMNLGMLLQHLTQFNPVDRPGLVAAQSLDRGPGVIAVVPDGPAAVAGLRAGDVLLAVDGAALPAESGLDAPFDPARARARADLIHDLLTPAESNPVMLTVLRDGATRNVIARPRATCPAQIHLARSDQRNAFADGRHVFLTTGVLARLTDDDEVAFVVAHEMAHNVLRHATLLRREKHGGAIVRRTEREADKLAGELMLDAGYDPVAGVRALQRLGGGVDLDPDHESDGARADAMRVLVRARELR